MANGIKASDDSDRFPTTSWTMIVNARDRDPKVAREALDRLCRGYWNPVFAFVRRKGFDPDQAGDRTQAFFTALLEKDYLADIERSKGNFRSFLLAAVKHFLSNQLGAERALKRGGGRPILPLEFEGADGLRRHEPEHSLTPEAVFEFRWAESLLDRTLKRLRGSSYRRCARRSCWTHDRRGAAQQIERLPGDMKRPNFARLNPWTRKQNTQLEQFLETENHEWRDASERHRKDRDEKERQLDLALFQERREGSNWLENREMRMSARVLEYQRTLVAAQIAIRKRLGLECPALLSDAQLSRLEETMLRSLHVGRQARRGDYERRARAAGVPAQRSEHRDAAEYGDLEALVRREVRQLVLARSLGRIGKKPSRLRSMFKVGSEWEPLVKLLAAILAFGGAAIALYRLLR